MSKRLFSLLNVFLIILFLQGCTPIEKSKNASIEASIETSIETDPKWIDDIARVTSTNASCQEKWDILWGWSKKGNLQARNGLSSMIWFGMLDRPGSDGYTASRQRDFVILSVHSFGYTDDYPGTKSLKLATFSTLNKINYAAAERVRRCEEKGFAHKCSSMAVQEGLVPSFEGYVEEIEKYISQGFKPNCRLVH